MDRFLVPLTVEEAVEEEGPPPAPASPLIRATSKILLARAHGRTRWRGIQRDATQTLGAEQDADTSLHVRGHKTHPLTHMVMDKAQSLLVVGDSLGSISVIDWCAALADGALSPQPSSSSASASSSSSSSPPPPPGHLAPVLVLPRQGGLVDLAFDAWGDDTINALFSRTHSVAQYDLGVCGIGPTTTFTAPAPPLLASPRMTTLAKVSGSRPRLLLAGSSNGALFGWDPRGSGDRPAWSAKGAHEGPVGDMSIAHDALSIASAGGMDGRIALWDIRAPNHPLIVARTTALSPRDASSPSYIHFHPQVPECLVFLLRSGVCGVWDVMGDPDATRSRRVAGKTTIGGRSAIAPRPPINEDPVFDLARLRHYPSLALDGTFAFTLPDTPTLHSAFFSSSGSLSRRTPFPSLPPLTYVDYNPTQDSTVVAPTPVPEAPEKSLDAYVARVPLRESSPVLIRLGDSGVDALLALHPGTNTLSFISGCRCDGDDGDEQVVADDEEEPAF